MYAVRRWSVRHARALETGYRLFERALAGLHPVFERVGYPRLERPVAAIEKRVKGFLFDCRMCGQCVLGATGMSCPMNCPKSLRNGPCGGVRASGHCEVDPRMMCVWVDAVAGSQSMRAGSAAIRLVQLPVDQRLQGRSSWLAAARGEVGAPT